MLYVLDYGQTLLCPWYNLLMALLSNSFKKETQVILIGRKTACEIKRFQVNIYQITESWIISFAMRSSLLVNRLNSAFPKTLHTYETITGNNCITKVVFGYCFFVCFQFKLPLFFLVYEHIFCSNLKNTYVPLRKQWLTQDVINLDHYNNWKWIPQVYWYFNIGVRTSMLSNHWNHIETHAHINVVQRFTLFLCFQVNIWLSWIYSFI